MIRFNTLKILLLAGVLTGVVLTIFLLVFDSL